MKIKANILLLRDSLKMNTNSIFSIRSKLFSTNKIFRDFKKPNKASQLYSSVKRTFCDQQTNQKQDEDLYNVKQISEYKLGLQYLLDAKYDLAETHFKECLKILKNTNQTDTYSYLYVLRKFTQTLFFNKKYAQAEELFKSAVSLSQKIGLAAELIFVSQRNLLAFYTYTDIEKADVLVTEYVNDTTIPKNINKYFRFAIGPIKFLKNDYNSQKYLSESISLQLPDYFHAYALHNLAVSSYEIQRHFNILPEETKENFLKLNNLTKEEIEANCKNFTVFMKLALKSLEVDMHSKMNIEKSKDTLFINKFLSSSEEFPNNITEEKVNELISEFTSGRSGLSITCLAEHFFEQGKAYEKHAAFWLKLGIKYYEKYEPQNIARHLILFALFYSQMEQTMIAEGLYRKSLEMLKNSDSYNLVFAMNMFGRLMLRVPNRVKEANSLLQKSEELLNKLPYWHDRLCKVRILDFDFDNE